MKPRPDSFKQSYAKARKLVAILETIPELQNASCATVTIAAVMLIHRLDPVQDRTSLQTYATFLLTGKEWMEELT